MENCWIAQSWPRNAKLFTLTGQAMENQFQFSEKYFLIKGETRCGQRFRPSDWSERLATTQASFDKNKRLQYHQHIKPIMLDGAKCLKVNQKLIEQEPHTADFLLEFARFFNLQIEEYA